MSEEKGQQVDFNIVPDDVVEVPRTYSNFCAIQNSPFDFTLTFCDMQPPTEKQLREAQTTHIVKAPIRARLAIPVQMVPGLISALQDNFRLYQQSFGPTRGPGN
jgi:hypothetical protein